MRHAGAEALDRLEPLLAEIHRLRPDLRERSRGVFFERSAAFLHFHEDATGLFADVKVAEAWGRFDVTAAAGRDAVLRIVSASRELTRTARSRPAAGAPRRSSNGRPGPR